MATEAIWRQERGPQVFSVAGALPWAQSLTPVGSRPIHTCDRCGIRREGRVGRKVHNLCVDCRTVAKRLGELEVWT